MMLQLNPPIELDTEPRGRGWAHFVIDYGPEHDLWSPAADHLHPTT